MPLLGTRGAAASKGFGLTAFAPKPYAASYLVIAGGGGASGASSYMLGGGGGGAGGYRNAYASETSGGGGSTEDTPGVAGRELAEAKLDCDPMESFNVFKRCSHRKHSCVSPVP